MTSNDYREQAERLLTPLPGDFTISPERVQQAAVWAQLAQAAAITETAAIAQTAHAVEESV
ncbi:hypothetical protein SSP531S_56430 [Streptomyces spongiicola]|uniref:Uncharacterized protein n=1 Tax=Streptomyces spongiicola TaxID=1690221 RepID=A0A388T7A5_9ACTN|nr:hypothetical protein [Streptomyces spongiicola]GBQ04151.1 hypothetical protein SSP531S_56430 [Streptomyces spongiicola]